MTEAQTTRMTATRAATARTVISLMHVSLDGFVAGPNGELDWAHVDDETYADVAAALDTVDTALYGRATYQGMESYWPAVPTDPASTENERHHAEWYENVRKVVFSRTLASVSGNNRRLVNEDIAVEVARLKSEPGKDMMIFGSPRVVHTLARHGLIDEYRIHLNPVALGDGMPLFKGGEGATALALLAMKSFRSGVVGLHYRVRSNGSAR